jgi:hypothetical protein
VTKLGYWMMTCAYIIILHSNKKGFIKDIWWFEEMIMNFKQIKNISRKFYSVWYRTCIICRLRTWTQNRISFFQCIYTWRKILEGNIPNNNYNDHCLTGLNKRWANIHCKYFSKYFRLCNLYGQCHSSCILPS